MPIPPSRVAAVLLLLAAASCAAPPPPEPAPVKSASTAGWERAPTPNIIERRRDVYFGSQTRGELGWPDRYSGAPAGAPYRPRF